LVVSVMLRSGVKVAVQVMPPALPLTVGAVGNRQVGVVKPVTASLKVMVTSEVSPMRELCRPPRWSVGRTVSMA
jgi:hypothetical protein